MISVGASRRRNLALLGAACLLYEAWALATGRGFPCVFHWVTGLLCPGCGGQRCLLALLRLDVSGALRANALLLVLSPFWVWLVARMAWGYVCGIGFRPTRTQRRWIGAALVLTVLFGVARNVPGAWFLRP